MPAPNYALAGELLLAASGLWPKDPIDRALAAKARDLPVEWATELEKLLTGAEPTKPWRAPAIRYLATWRRLNDVAGAADDRLVRDVQVPEIGAAYQEARLRALDYLRRELRPIRVEGMRGMPPRLLEPSSSEQQRADALVAVVGDPGRVVYGFRAGAASPDAFDAVAEVYPETQKMLEQMIEAEMFRQRSRRVSYRVPYRAEAVLRPFLGDPMGGSAATIDVSEQEDAGGGPPPSEQVPEIQIQRHRHDEQTRADRVADLSPEL